MFSTSFSGGYNAYAQRQSAVEKANKSKEIATNFPKLGKKAALSEALRQYGISKSAESIPTDTNVVESSSRMTGAPIK